MAGGSEVVEVEYDPARTNLANLADALKQQSSFYSLIVQSDEEKKQAGRWLGPSEIRIKPRPSFIESKYSLRSQHPELYYLDLTEEQAIRLNAWSYFGGSQPDVLREDQKVLLPRLRSALQSGQTPAWIPERDPRGREEYRARLLQWLDSN